MHIAQKSFFHRIEAKADNQKLCYKQTYFFATTLKECPLYDLDDTVYEYPYKNRGAGIFSAVMLIGVIIVSIDMLFNENTLDNLLFYAIPSAVSGCIFFMTMQKRMYIDSKAGTFEFLATQEAVNFLAAVLDTRTGYTKYNTSSMSTRSFEECIADLQQKYSAEAIDKKELSAWIDRYAEILLKCPCPVCNKHKGINALKIGTAFGVIICTVVHSEVFIGCSECMKAAVKKANRTSLCFGIWSAPWGLFVPPLVLWQNNSRLKHLQMHIPSSTLKKHVARRLKKKT